MRKVLLLLPVLVACADRGAELDAQMSAYVGRSESELVTGLGVPNRVQDLEGRRFLDYDLGGSVAGPTVAPSVGLGFGSGGGVGFGIGTGIIFGRRAAPECGVTFELQQGRVQSFSRRGSGCA